MQSKVIIHHHLGLGDHIMMNGCVRHLYEDYPQSEILLIVKQIHYNNVSYMYRDLDRLTPVAIPAVNEELEVHNVCQQHQGANVISIGFGAFHALMQQFPDSGCDELFYKQLEMPYEYRWDKHYFERDINEEGLAFDKINPTKEPYIFVHDDPLRGFNLNVNSSYKIIRNDPTIGIFHLFKILSEAEEIHIMESSIRCLIEDPRLVLKSNPNYYDIRGHLWLKPHTTRWDWNIIRGNERWSIDSVKNSIQ